MEIITLHIALADVRIIIHWACRKRNLKMYSFCRLICKGMLTLSLCDKNPKLSIKDVDVLHSVSTKQF